MLAATAVLTASTSVVFPLLAELQQAYDLPTWSLGVISGSAFIAGLAAQLLLAPLADRGHVRLLLLGGLGLAAISGLLFATGSTLWQLTLGRLVAGVAVGSFIPAARAVASTIEPARAGHHLGRLAAAELGGFVCGPIAGSALYELTNLRAPFAIFAGLAVAGLALLSRRTLPSHLGSSGSSAPSLSLLRRPQVVVAALLALALFLPVGVYDALWARYMADRGAGPLFVGVTLAMYGIPFVVLASTGGKVADRFGPVRSAFVCLLIIAPLTFLYGSLASLGLILAVSLVEATAQAVAVPASQAAMAKATPPAGSPPARASPERCSSSGPGSWPSPPHPCTGPPGRRWCSRPQRA